MNNNKGGEVGEGGGEGGEGGKGGGGGRDKARHSTQTANALYRFSPLCIYTLQTCNIYTAYICGKHKRGVT